MKEKQKNFIRNAIGSSFGLGLSPVLPGSFGTLPAVLLHWLFIQVNRDFVIQLVFLFVYMLLVSLIHYRLTEWAIRYYKTNDPGQFVLDEIVGYLYTQIQFILMLLVFKPAFLTDSDGSFTLGKMILWGFLFFRILDMIKIPPAWQVDKKMHGATGILLDDIISGFYAAILMYALFHFSVL